MAIAISQAVLQHRNSVAFPVPGHDVQMKFKRFRVTGNMISGWVPSFDFSCSQSIRLLEFPRSHSHFSLALFQKKSTFVLHLSKSLRFPNESGKSLFYKYFMRGRIQLGGTYWGKWFSWNFWVEKWDAKIWFVKQRDKLKKLDFLCEHFELLRDSRE